MWPSSFRWGRKPGRGGCRSPSGLHGGSGLLVTGQVQLAWRLPGDGPRRLVGITSGSIPWERRQSAERRDTAMPSYEYECTKCGRKFEVMQTFEEHDRH